MVRSNLAASLGGGAYVRAHAAVALLLSLTVRLLRSQLLDNSDTGASAPPSLSLNSCLLDSNEAMLDGGAVALLAGSVTFTSGAVSSNAAGGDGGGVSVKVRIGAPARVLALTSGLLAGHVSCNAVVSGSSWQPGCSIRRRRHYI